MKKNYDFHILDSIVTPETLDEEYCLDPEDKMSETWVPFLSFPITQTCNFRCVYCGAGGEATASECKLITVEQVDQIVKEAAAKGVKKFRITGGEPFTHPDIDKILDLMNEYGYFTLINTNGSLITRHEDIINKLGDNFHFAVSFDTLHPEKLKRISGVSTHQNVVDGVRLLSKKKLLMRLNTVVTTYNYDEISDIIKLCEELGCDLKLLDVVSVPVPFGQRQSIYQEISTLEKNFSESCDEILFHEYTRGFGTPCRRYRFGSVHVTVKNSVKGSHYDRVGEDAICANCPYYPCHEGLYDLFALSDGRICSCRWTERQMYETTSEQLDYLINAFRRSTYVNKNGNEDMSARKDLADRINR